MIERTLTLPGGVSVSIPVAGGQTWSYPNLHGDSIINADAAGARLGARTKYDPFGQPIDPTTGNIGTTTADDAIANTSPGEADYGWVGSHRKLYEHQGSIATIEMGARQYVPSLAGSWKLTPSKAASPTPTTTPPTPSTDTTSAEKSVHAH